MNRDQRPSGYPTFDDADVMILSPSGQVWELHSVILSTASPAIAKVLASFSPQKLKKVDIQEGRTIRWKLMMVDEPLGRICDRAGILYKSFQPINVNTPCPIGFIQVYNGVGAGPKFDHIYDNFFRCLYNLDPMFDQDMQNSQAGYISDAIDLLQAASLLDARQAVCTIIEAHLLRLDDILFHDILNKPEGWASIACRLNSATIFREAMIHLCGRFLLHVGVRKETLYKLEYGRTIFELLIKKTKELKHKKLRIERRLTEFYPDVMVHHAEDGIVAGRAIYATDIYLWQGLTIVRQFLSSAYQSNMHHRAPDGGLSFYRNLYDGQYLDANTLERFHQLFDMSNKSRAILSHQLDYLKKELKVIVEPLLKDVSRSSNRPNATPLEHFACTTIEDNELPWLKTLTTPNVGPDTIEENENESAAGNNSQPEGDGSAEAVVTASESPARTSGPVKG